MMMKKINKIIKKNNTICSLPLLLPLTSLSPTGTSRAKAFVSLVSKNYFVYFGVVQRRGKIQKNE